MIKETIRAMLERRNMRQDDLAEASGVSKTQINHILTGKSNPRQSTIEKIAAALDTTAADLITTERVMFKAPAAPSPAVAVAPDVVDVYK